MKTQWGLSRFQFVTAFILVSVVWLPAFSARAESFDTGVENEAVLANSEGAIAEAEEAKKRATDEKEKNEREQKAADAQTEKARQVEADAKLRMAQFMSEEARLKKQREAAQIRKQTATDQIKQTQTEIQAREMQLNVLRDMSDKTVAERDQLELQVKKNNEELHRVDKQIAAEKRRKTDSETALAASREKLARSNRRLESANNRLDAAKNRAPSSVAGASVSGSAAAGSSKEGWVHLKKDCDLKAAADDSAAQAKSVKQGDRLYGRRVDSNWIEVRDKAAGSTTGYLAINCVR